jgi:hypothetical protein
MTMLSSYYARPAIPYNLAMTGSEPNHFVITKRRAIVLGIAATIFQGLCDLFLSTILQSSMIYLLEFFIGVSGYWTPALSLKLSKRASTKISRLVPLAVVPLVVFGVLAASMLLALHCCFSYTEKKYVYLSPPNIITDARTGSKVFFAYRKRFFQRRIYTL